MTIPAAMNMKKKRGVRTLINEWALCTIAYEGIVFLEQVVEG